MKRIHLASALLVVIGNSAVDRLEGVSDLTLATVAIEAPRSDTATDLRRGIPQCTFCEFEESGMLGGLTQVIYSTRLCTEGDEPCAECEILGWSRYHVEPITGDTVESAFTAGSEPCANGEFTAFEGYEPCAENEECLPISSVDLQMIETLVHGAIETNDMSVFRFLLNAEMPGLFVGYAAGAVEVNACGRQSVLIPVGAHLAQQLDKVDSRAP